MELRPGQAVGESTVPWAPVALFDLVFSVARTTSYVSRSVADHGTLVASIGAEIGRQLGFSEAALEAAIVAGVLHDVGALAHEGAIDELGFEAALDAHAERGYSLLAGVEPLRRAASLVRHHHVPWRHGRGESEGGDPVDEGAHVLHLADTVAMCFEPRRSRADNRTAAHAVARASAGDRFVPAHVDAFLDVSGSEVFWIDSVEGAEASVRGLGRSVGAWSLDRQLTLSLAETFSQIIDLRSRYTAAHGLGVAKVARVLGDALGWTEEMCDELWIAGCLHDLGKIAIPRAVLEKAGALDDYESRLVRSHAYLTHRALDGLPGYEQIGLWAAQHHERLNGKGYPFHLPAKQIALGSRIIAIADVYAALVEDRPYRAGLRRGEVLEILASMVHDGGLDGDVVELARREIDDLEGVLREGPTAVPESRFNSFALTGDLLLP